MQEGTFEALFRTKLLENGLWCFEADGILAAVKADPEERINDVMQQQVEGYPPQMLAVGWVVIRSAAVRWLEPNHWARPLFMSEAERDALLRR